MKKTCFILGTALSFFPLAAQAALINDYGQTDDISEKTLPSYGQHIGIQIPLKKGLTTDLGLALNEYPGNLSTLTPQLGFTALF